MNIAIKMDAVSLTTELTTAIKTETTTITGGT
jgi:hypothetical protein